MISVVCDADTSRIEGFYSREIRNIAVEYKTHLRKKHADQ